ncbi:hypothetical protein HBH98_146430 [Parastagonospora nodorum]|nr:hypothetical protein HBH53_152230 [Parastagonospora nodorum]KAH3964878.1 hypothetical protein HBH51_155190 [Parastagonospora nodorum]KAH4017348.1 hypothetical protein HBI09_196130 [Parastagonospora nodorum]KAH4047060.1 hypothetical protein HBH49_176960 [Parastagonospora nodorum]KAH4062946.1 hypothetical protein HBH50_197340 [Parastagonospora nodorum]
MVLGELDIVSLLTSRPDIELVMSTVNAMSNYDKIIRQAWNFLRMALAINTAHSFTLKQLFAKVYQKQCSIKGYPFPEDPVCDLDVYGMDYLIIDEDVKFPARSIKAMKGRYRNHCNDYEVFEDAKEMDRTLYDFSDVRERFRDSEDDDEDGIPRSIRERREGEWVAEYPDPTKVPFMTVEDFAAYVRERKEV